MRTIILLTSILVFSLIVKVSAFDYSPLQYCYYIHHSFPQMEMITIIIDEDSLETKKASIERSLCTFSLKAVVYPIGNAHNLSRVLKELTDSSLVWVIGSEKLDHTIFLSPLEFICHQGNTTLINQKVLQNHAQNQLRHPEYEQASK